MRKIITLFGAALIAVTVSCPGLADNSTTGTDTNIAKVFEDTKASPYYEDICYVTDKGIMDGTGADKFSPEDVCSRETAAVALYRMACSPDTSGSVSFNDVEEGRSCKKAVVWGAENGLIKGVEADKFAPDSGITYEQLVTFLFRYARFKGSVPEISDSKVLAAFSDAADISEWAADGFIWALNSGIIICEEGGRINPKAGVSRMQAAAVLTRYIKSSRMSYRDFKALTPEEQRKAFSEMSGDDIYNLVKESDENWPVTSYDLVSPDNAKEMIVLFGDDENIHFNLDWPHYGGFIPETIDSIGKLSGTVTVSRDGGDGGYSVTLGKNQDGSYPNDSQRSVPKTSATVRTGTLDIDKYKIVVDVVAGTDDKSTAVSSLISLGYTEETALRFVSDYEKWFERDEVSGHDNISDGAKLAGNEVEEKYGYCGLTAPWTVAGLKLEGGAGQLNTVFSWGTLCASGLIYDTATAEIK